MLYRVRMVILLIVLISTNNLLSITRYSKITPSRFFSIQNVGFIQIWTDCSFFGNNVVLHNRRRLVLFQI